MIKRILETPKRLWSYSQAFPMESIFYGALALALAAWGQPLLVAIAAICIVGGLIHLFGMSDV